MYGSIWDGVFEGNIETPEDGTYYVERATKYWDKDSRIFFLDALDTPGGSAEAGSAQPPQKLISSRDGNTVDHPDPGKRGDRASEKFHSVIYHETQVSDVPLGKYDGE